MKFITGKVNIEKKSKIKIILTLAMTKLICKPSPEGSRDLKITEAVEKQWQAQDSISRKHTDEQWKRSPGIPLWTMRMYAGHIYVHVPTPHTPHNTILHTLTHVHAK